LSEILQLLGFEIGDCPIAYSILIPLYDVIAADGAGVFSNGRWPSLGIAVRLMMCLA